VVLVTVPYLAYLVLLNVETFMAPLANLIETNVDSISRNLINAVVALLVGGPQMYATWTRTALDTDFFEKHTRLI
jgi:hypothetical protein